MTRTTPIILDRLDHALKAHGVALKRAQLLETAAYAMGYHSQNEFTAAAKAGALTPPAAEPVVRMDVGNETLIVLRDPVAGSLYAIDETFLEQVAGEERRERFGNSPYGHLLDVGAAADHPVTSWTTDPSKFAPSPSAQGRFVVLGEDGHVASRHNDEGTAKAEVEIDDNISLGMIVDVRDGHALHYEWGWRSLPIHGRDEAETIMAGALAVTSARLERERSRHAQTLRLDVPDWRSWEKDLKKASRKGQEPISDEILHQMRHAVADVHCKASSSEKSEVEWRQRRYVEKHLGGLLARLDRAEEALHEAGIAPAEIARKPKDDASEMLAAIEAVTSRRGGAEIPGVFEVDATRDGERCREIFQVGDGEDPQDRAREIAAKEFRMDLEEHRDEEGDLSSFDSECDSFYVEPVLYPEAAGIISDALMELSIGGDFRYGIPHSHPARIKLIAAREMITPKPTA